METNQLQDKSLDYVNFYYGIILHNSWDVKCVFSVQLCTNKNVWLQLVHVTHISSMVYLRLGLFGMNPVNGCSCWFVSIYKHTTRTHGTHVSPPFWHVKKVFQSKSLCARLGYCVTSLPGTKLILIVLHVRVKLIPRCSFSQTRIVLVLPPTPLSQLPPIL